LILDSYELTEHKSYFIPNSMQLTGQKGLTYYVSAQLEVYPNEDVDNGDFAYIYNALGCCWNTYLDRLDKIVNIDYQEALG